MADDRGASLEEQDWEDGRPEYLREISDLRFLNISIKTYEKKTGGGFPREEYYAYRIISMYVLTSRDGVCGRTGLVLAALHARAGACRSHEESSLVPRPKDNFFAWKQGI